MLVEFLLQRRQCLYEYMTHNGKTAWIHFVQRIFGRMPIGCRDVEIDDVAARHSAMDEGEMIVKRCDRAFVDEDIRITESRSGRPDQVRKPRRGVRVSFDLEIE